MSVNSTNPCKTSGKSGSAPSSGGLSPAGAESALSCQLSSVGISSSGRSR